MTDQPPPNHCWGPYRCRAEVRPQDRDLIPRFCSDACRDRFIAERRIIINAPAVPVHIHPELRQHVILSNVAPKGIVIIGTAPEVLTKQLLDQSARRAWIANTTPGASGTNRRFLVDAITAQQDELTDELKAEMRRRFLEAIRTEQPRLIAEPHGELHRIPLTPIHQSWWRRALNAVRNVIA